MLKRLLVSSICLSSYALAQTGAPFRIDLATASQTPSLAHGVIVTMSITNTSQDNEVFRSSFSGHEPEFFCKVVIHRSNGSHVEESAYKRRVEGSEGIALDFNSRFVTLKPGESFKEQIDISKLFKLTDTGAYDIQVERPVRDLDKDASTIKSTVLHLDIGS